MDEVYSGLLCTLYTTSGKVHWHPWANKKKNIRPFIDPTFSPDQIILQK